MNKARPVLAALLLFLGSNDLRIVNLFYAKMSVNSHWQGLCII